MRLNLIVACRHLLFNLTNMSKFSTIKTILLSKDEGITVLESGKKIVFTVKTKGYFTEGKTFRLSFKMK